mmetsp:Transcript_11473/g.26608  ORF Transcript_11473/g.26608 Transcript_11473/m.26608 type:complete len:399 (-) Transcript_11473:6-1202(-)
MSMPGDQDDDQESDVPVEVHFAPEETLEEALPAAAALLKVIDDDDNDVEMSSSRRQLDISVGPKWGEVDDHALDRTTRTQTAGAAKKTISPQSSAFLESLRTTSHRGAQHTAEDLHSTIQGSRQTRQLILPAEEQPLERLHLTPVAILSHSPQASRSEQQRKRAGASDATSVATCRSSDATYNQYLHPSRQLEGGMACIPATKLGAEESVASSSTGQTEGSLLDISTKSTSHEEKSFPDTERSEDRRSSEKAGTTTSKEGADNLKVVRYFPCRARGITSSTHDGRSAVLEVPPDCNHGTVLVCSNLECAASGRRFRFCIACDQPVSQRNFMKRHSHGLLLSKRYTIQDYLRDNHKQRNNASNNDNNQSATRNRSHETNSSHTEEFTMAMEDDTLNLPL